jgi:hypothetical protein
MKRAALVLATVATLGVTAVAAPAPAEARGGFGPGLAGGLIAGALIGGLVSNAYGYGPGMATATHLPTTVDMPRHITVTDIEEYTVRPMPTTAAHVIMAAGITGGIVIGNSD